MSPLDVHWHGETLVFDPRRAVFRPACRDLLLADWHLGKALHLQEAGVALPEAAMREEYARVGQLVEAYAPQRLVILGDWFHARLDAKEAVLRGVQALLDQVGCPVVLTVGNHDRAWLPDLKKLGVAVVDQLDAAPFCYVHGDQLDDEELSPLICGHLHPGRRVRLSGRTQALVRGFWLREAALVLPAFGELTRMAHMQEPSDQFFAILGGRTVKALVSRG